jgi:hypothetical protein
LVTGIQSLGCPDLESCRPVAREKRKGLQYGGRLWEKWRVAVGNQKWEHWLERLYSLRRDKRDDHERPHKPVLLLSIIDLLDRGVIRENAVPFSDELVAMFKRYFAVVKERDDKPTIENPFYFLAGDKFWQVIPQGGNEALYREGYASRCAKRRTTTEAGCGGTL